LKERSWTYPPLISVFSQVGCPPRKRFEQAVQTFNSTIRKPFSQPSDSGILLSAVELFTGRTGHNAEETRVFLELAKNLLPATSVRDRRQIANMLVTYPEAPDALIDLLAKDKDDLTAFPILRHSTNVSVDLLVEIVKVGSEAARKALAGRPHSAAPDSGLTV
jgi:hypothetical protein